MRIVRILWLILSGYSQFVNPALKMGVSSAIWRLMSCRFAKKLTIAISMLEAPPE
jgi:hypothetical protein